MKQSLMQLQSLVSKSKLSVMDKQKLKEQMNDLFALPQFQTLSREEHISLLQILPRVAEHWLNAFMHPAHMDREALAEDEKENEEENEKAESLQSEKLKQLHSWYQALHHKMSTVESTHERILFYHKFRQLYQEKRLFGSALPVHRNSWELLPIERIWEDFCHLNQLLSDPEIFSPSNKILIEFAELLLNFAEKYFPTEEIKQSPTSSAPHPILSSAQLHALCFNKLEDQYKTELKIKPKHPWENFAYQLPPAMQRQQLQLWALLFHHHWRLLVLEHSGHSEVVLNAAMNLDKMLWYWRRILLNHAPAEETHLWQQDWQHCTWERIILALPIPAESDQILHEELKWQRWLLLKPGLLQCLTLLQILLQAKNPKQIPSIITSLIETKLEALVQYWQSRWQDFISTDFGSGTLHPVLSECRDYYLLVLSTIREVENFLLPLPAWLRKWEGILTDTLSKNFWGKFSVTDKTTQALNILAENILLPPINQLLAYQVACWQQLQAIIKMSVDLLGLPPTPLQICVVGSLATQTANQGSDIDLEILITQHTPAMSLYLQSFRQILQQQALSIGRLLDGCYAHTPWQLVKATWTNLVSNSAGINPLLESPAARARMHLRPIYATPQGETLFSQYQALRKTLWQQEEKGMILNENQGRIIHPSAQETFYNCFYFGSHDIQQSLAFEEKEDPLYQKIYTWFGVKNRTELINLCLTTLTFLHEKENLIDYLWTGILNKKVPCREDKSDLLEYKNYETSHAFLTKNKFNSQNLSTAKLACYADDSEKLNDVLLAWNQQAKVSAERLAEIAQAIHKMVAAEKHLKNSLTRYLSDWCHDYFNQNPEKITQAMIMILANSDARHLRLWRASAQNQLQLVAAWGNKSHDHQLDLLIRSEQDWIAPMFLQACPQALSIQQKLSSRYYQVQITEQQQAYFVLASQSHSITASKLYAWQLVDKASNRVKLMTHDKEAFLTTAQHQLQIQSKGWSLARISTARYLNLAFLEYFAQLYTTEKRKRLWSLEKKTALNVQEDFLRPINQILHHCSNFLELRSPTEEPLVGLGWIIDALCLQRRISEPFAAVLKALVIYLQTLRHRLQTLMEHAILNPIVRRDQGFLPYQVLPHGYPPQSQLRDDEYLALMDADISVIMPLITYLPEWWQNEKLPTLWDPIELALSNRKTNLKYTIALARCLVRLNLSPIVHQYYFRMAHKKSILFGNQVLDLDEKKEPLSHYYYHSLQHLALPQPAATKIILRHLNDYIVFQDRRFYLKDSNFFIWNTQLLQLTEAVNEKNSQAPQLIWYDVIDQEIKHRTLPDHISKRLFTEDKRLNHNKDQNKQQKLDGTRLVLPIYASDMKIESSNPSDQPIAYLKLFPQRPARQMLAAFIGQQICGYGMDFTFACLYQPQTKQRYPVLLSPARGRALIHELGNIKAIRSLRQLKQSLAQTTTMPEIYQLPPQLYQVDAHYFALKFFEIMILRYGDGSPSNVSIAAFQNGQDQKAYRFLDHDGDQIFSDSWQREYFLKIETKKLPGLKHILLCLPQMQAPLAQTAIDEFCQLPVNTILNRSLKIVSDFEAKHIASKGENPNAIQWTHEELLTLAYGQYPEQRPEDACHLMMIFPKQEITRLYKRFSDLQTWLRETTLAAQTNSQPNPSALDLLQRFASVEARYISVVLTHANLSPLERYALVNDPQFIKTVDTHYNEAKNIPTKELPQVTHLPNTSQFLNLENEISRSLGVNQTVKPQQFLQDCQFEKKQALWQKELMTAVNTYRGQQAIQLCRDLYEDKTDYLLELLNTHQQGIIIEKTLQLTAKSKKLVPPAVQARILPALVNFEYAFYSLDLLAWSMLTSKQLSSLLKSSNQYLGELRVSLNLPNAFLTELAQWNYQLKRLYLTQDESLHQLGSYYHPFQLKQLVSLTLHQLELRQMHLDLPQLQQLKIEACAETWWLRIIAPPLQTIILKNLPRILELECNSHKWSSIAWLGLAVCHQDPPVKIDKNILITTLGVTIKIKPIADLQTALLTLSWFYGIMYVDLNLLKQIYQTFPQFVATNPIDAIGKTGLHWAAERNYIEILKSLLSLNLNINQKDDGQQTALQSAVDAYACEAVNCLIQAGADLFDDEKEVDVQSAKMSIPQQIVQAARTAKRLMAKKDDSIWLAAYRGDEKQLTRLLQEYNNHSKALIDRVIIKKIGYFEKIDKTQFKSNALYIYIKYGYHMHNGVYARKYKGVAYALGLPDKYLDNDDLCRKLLQISNSSNTIKREKSVREILILCSFLPTDHPLNDNSSLMIAIQKNHLLCVQMLLTANASLNLNNDHVKLSPLLLASVLNHEAIIDSLLLAKAEVNQPLYNQAIFNGSNLNILKKIKKNVLPRKSFSKYLYDEHQGDALYRAVAHNNWTRIQSLLKVNVNINACSWFTISFTHTEYSSTNKLSRNIEETVHMTGYEEYRIDPRLLHKAAKQGYLFLIANLLAANADPFRRDISRDNIYFGYLPLSYAIEYGHVGVATLLLKNMKTDISIIYLLYQAAFPGDRNYSDSREEVCKTMNKHIAKDARHYPDSSPLRIPIENQYAPMVQFLLEIKAKVDHRDPEGCTPLYFAAEGGSLSITKLLLLHRPNINLGKKTSLFSSTTTPKQAAELKGHTAVVDLLTRYEKNPDEVIKELKQERSLKPRDNSHNLQASDLDDLKESDFATPIPAEQKNQHSFSSSTQISTVRTSLFNPSHSHVLPDQSLKSNSLTQLAPQKKRRYSLFTVPPGLPIHKPLQRSASDSRLVISKF